MPDDHLLNVSAPYTRLTALLRQCSRIRCAVQSGFINLDSNQSFVWGLKSSLDRIHWSDDRRLESQKHAKHHEA